MATTRHRMTNTGIALVSIWLGVVVYAYLRHFALWLTVFDFQFDPWPQIRGTTLYVWTPWLLLAPVVQYAGARLPIRPRQWPTRILQHLFVMTLLATVHGYACALLYYHIGLFDDGMEAYAPWQHTGHFLFMDGIYLMDAFIYACLVASQNINLGYLLARRNELDRVRLQAKLTEARMQALKMQINPHFLFNTLNSIASLARMKEPEKVEEMIAQLSELFRRTLEHGNNQLITLREEMELIERYLALEQTRFGDRLSVELDLDPDSLDTPVPALLLQPLAENAVRHGLAGSDHCTLRLTARKSPRGLQLVVSDDGCGSGARPVAGVGLTNVRARLETLYRGLQTFDYTSRAGSGTVVSILIPDLPAAPGLEAP